MTSYSTLKKELRLLGISPSFIHGPKEHLLSIHQRCEEIRNAYRDILSWTEVSAELNYWLDESRIGIPVNEVISRIRKHASSRPDQIGMK